MVKRFTCAPKTFPYKNKGRSFSFISWSLKAVELFRIYSFFEKRKTLEEEEKRENRAQSGLHYWEAVLCPRTGQALNALEGPVYFVDLPLIHRFPSSQWQNTSFSGVSLQGDEDTVAIVSCSKENKMRQLPVIRTKLEFGMEATVVLAWLSVRDGSHKDECVLGWREMFRHIVDKRPWSPGVYIDGLDIARGLTKVTGLRGRNESRYAEVFSEAAEPSRGKVQLERRSRRRQ